MDFAMEQGSGPTVVELSSLGGFGTGMKAILVTKTLTYMPKIWDSTVLVVYIL